MKKEYFNLTIFLMDNTITDFASCIKSPSTLFISDIKSEFDINGRLFLSPSNFNMPKWKIYLDEIAKEPIVISKNISNKAALIVKLDERFVAVTFGYGRSLLKEENIVKNFGLKVTLNVLNPLKIRSINASTIEDMIVTTQRQTSSSASQDEFGLNIFSDIMKAATGVPENVKYGKTISGKDSLVISIKMTLYELNENLKFYLNAYQSNQYIENGFEWIDNIGEIKDIRLKDKLNEQLKNTIISKDTSMISLAPPDIIDWERTLGFSLSGMGANVDSEHDYSLDIDLNSYLQSIKPNIDVISKLKRDKLNVINADEVAYPISSIYSALLFQTSENNYTYILNNGSWYEVQTRFYDYVIDFIASHVPVSDIELPNCPANVDEETYNKLVAESNIGYCCMDRKFTSVEAGPKKIESCDIFTTKKQFIHVKNKTLSGQLSHLFSQGKVSAQCFTSDIEFRRQVLELTKEKFNYDIFPPSRKPEPYEYEVVYVIVDYKVGKIHERLPFFSLVNLMMTVRDLERINMRYSIRMIQRDSM